MIEHLSASRAAYFYKRRKPLSKRGISDLFRALRAAAIRPSGNLFYANRDSLGGVRYSAVCFSHERTPSFLKPAADEVERVYGYMLVVEKGHLLAVFKSGLDLPSGFKSEYVERIGTGRVERAIARHDAIFEKLRLRNMSTAKSALRSKTLEARDLENAVALSSASRFVPLGYSVRRPDGTYSATPSTGRISIRSDRADYQDLVCWAAEIMDLLVTPAGTASAFIRNFARPLELADLPAGVHPTYLGIDRGSLSELVFEQDAPVRLVHEAGGTWTELTQEQVEPLLVALDGNFAINSTPLGYQVVDPDTGEGIGALKIGKTRIALYDLAASLIGAVFVEDRSKAVGDDPDRKSLARYIDREDLFTVLFSDLSLAYLDGSLFQDEALLGGGAAFLDRLRPVAALASTTSEKGSFMAGQASFDPTSVFRAVVDHVSNEDILICDDLSDEWADFIGIRSNGSPASVNFYHAKGGDISLSASAFHDAVGQAIKNLGRMSLPAVDMPRKLNLWSAPYRNGATTAISRLVRGGTLADIKNGINRVRSAPDTVRHVFIVTSSLSRNQVEVTFQSAAAGTPPPPYFVQLYWLLMSYFSACAEIGAVGFVVCRP